MTTGNGYQFPFESEDEKQSAQLIRDIFPEPWMFKRQRNVEGLVPCDSHGFVFTREQWLFIRHEVELFFAKTDSQEIDRYNLQVHKQYFPDHNEPASWRPSAPAPSKNARPGYIYVAHSDTGHYKIGLSVNPEKRIQHFGTQMPVDVTLIHTFSADDMYSAESELHSIFADKRVNGEWFNLSQEDVEWLCCITGYNDETFHANS